MRHAKIVRSALAALVLAGSVAGCSLTSGRETAGEYLDDTTITTRVKAALIADKTVKASQIGVETMQNVVQLSGFVDTPQEKLRAGDIARNVSGVREVQNNIAVR
jgi:hyperosmotically inducible protein